MSRSYGILSTYAPTQCGLATFSQALAQSLAGLLERVGVVSVVDEAEPYALPEVCHQWPRAAAGGAAAAAAALNRHDVAIIQHEYGIFGGRDGADVLDVVRALRVPAIVVMHTVLAVATTRQTRILEALARRCAVVVTMTQTARLRLLQHYDVDPGKIQVIPHGAPDPGLVPGPGTPAGGSTGSAPVILTWGLLGEGKGIEWGIEAMAQLRDLVPAPSYLIAGQTHPKVLERHGERYRRDLVARAGRLGVQDSVRFDARYLSSTELHGLVRGADVVLLPYDSREQVTSGVLIEAVAAGRPVVSTGFPHARELLSGGAGLIVGRRDPAAIAAALRRVLTEPGLAGGMTATARGLAPDLLWSAVAARYRDAAAAAIGTSIDRASA